MELNVRFDFMKYRILAYGISIVTFVATLFLYVSPGLNLGVDFAGGTLLHLRFTAQVEDTLIRNIFEKDLAIKDPTVQSAETRTVGTGDATAAAKGASFEKIIRVPFLPSEPTAGQKSLKETLAALNVSLAKSGIRATTGTGEVQVGEVLSQESVGASISGELRSQAFIATLISFILILIYVTVQFEFSYAVPAVISLVHDSVITVGFLIVTGYELNMITLAVILTLIGYSINDTIVICDRIRENLRIMKKTRYRDLVNLSLNQTLTRTMFTGTTTLLPLISMALFGGPVLNTFAVPMIFGIAIGTFSSIYVVSALIVDWKQRFESPSRA